MGCRGRGSVRPGPEEGAWGSGGCHREDADARADAAGPSPHPESGAGAAHGLASSQARRRRPRCAPLCAARSRRAPGVSKSGQLMGRSLIGCSAVSSPPARAPSRPPPASLPPPRPPTPAPGSAACWGTICSPPNKGAAPRVSGGPAALRHRRGRGRQQRAAAFCLGSRGCGWVREASTQPFISKTQTKKKKKKSPR